MHFNEVDGVCTFKSRVYKTEHTKEFQIEKYTKKRLKISQINKNVNRKQALLTKVISYKANLELLRYK